MLYMQQRNRTDRESPGLPGAPRLLARDDDSTEHVGACRSGVSPRLSPGSPRPQQQRLRAAAACWAAVSGWCCANKCSARGCGRWGCAIYPRAGARGKKKVSVRVPVIPRVAGWAAGGAKGGKGCVASQSRRRKKANFGWSTLLTATATRRQLCPGIPWAPPGAGRFLPRLSPRSPRIASARPPAGGFFLLRVTD